MCPRETRTESGVGHREDPGECGLGGYLEDGEAFGLRRLHWTSYQYSVAVCRNHVWFIHSFFGEQEREEVKEKLVSVLQELFLGIREQWYERPREGGSLQFLCQSLAISTAFGQYRTPVFELDLQHSIANVFAWGDVLLRSPSAISVGECIDSSKLFDVKDLFIQRQS
jgi:hypothetical protein